ncbi:U-box domain-containing protein 52-like isoform X2 [Spinacia oleracea]|uniref:RING-type E3 ubiquitin transferase n=1 Tax=Spinacia oleracea TaxID=3562 RepID=A0A9R0K303_SPIOL|nr:U-box domain-containing protein 52-like isoform X2 [Spinacia oleracea]
MFLPSLPLFTFSFPLFLFFLHPKERETIGGRAGPGMALTLSDDLEPMPINTTAAAVDKDKHSQYAVKWAVDHLLCNNRMLILIHVKQRNPNGTDGVTEGLDPEIQNIFIPYRGFCARKMVQVKEVVLDDADVARAIVDYVNNNNITNIVMGASTRNAIKKTFKKPDVPSHVTKYAPEFCSVYVIAKSKLSNLRSAQRPFASSSASPNRLPCLVGPAIQPQPQPTVEQPQPIDDFNTRMFQDGSLKWIKVTFCCCNPPKISEIRMSDTLSNPGRPTYKCRFCGFFAWVNEEDIIGSAEEVFVEQRMIAGVKETLDEFIKYIKLVVKIAGILYFVHVLFVVSM